MIAFLLLCATPSLEENEARFQKAVDTKVAKDVKAFQRVIDDCREQLNCLPKSDKAKAKELRDKIAELERNMKAHQVPRNRPKILYLDHDKPKAGDIGAFGPQDDNDSLRVTVVQVIDKETFIARKLFAGAGTLYYVEDYPTKKLEEGETTLLRGTYEVTGLDTAPGPPMWHIKPFLLPEPRPNK